MPNPISNRTGKVLSSTLSPRSRRSSSGNIQSLWAGGTTYSVDFMVLAGGGGGGANYAGGGAGGGLRSTVTATGRGASLESSLSLTSGSYTLTVGAAGVWTGGYAGSYGGNSQFQDIISLGGGGGRNGSGSTRGINGCGAGGSNDNGWTGHYGTLGQGYDGGNGGDFRPGGNLVGGGGGGTGSAGGNASGVTPGGGGSATSVAITGSSVSYGSGNTGSNYGSGYTGSAGGTNTGGGGGSGSNFSNFPGANGGSGIVVIRYADSLPDLAGVGSGLTKSGGGLTPTTTSGGYKIYTFTAGSDTITFA